VKKIKIKSVSMTPLGILEDDFLSILRKAAEPVLAATDPGRITDVYFSSFAPRELCGITDPLRSVAQIVKERFPQCRAAFHGPFKTGGEAMHAALQNGFAADREILILACEKMTHTDARDAALLLANRVNPHDRAYGATLPALGALVSRSYMQQKRVPYSAFHRVSVKNHKNAMLNPKAQFHRIIDERMVASSPMISDPLRRLHCAPTSDGAVALLLSQQRGTVYYRAWACEMDTALFQERVDISRFRATARASRTAHRQGGTKPEDIDVVEIHDAFSPFELINLEEMGFYRSGEAWHGLDAGELNINGRIAVNPSGGMKARGHPIGICGLSSIVEVYEQLTQCAGSRQHKAARLGMIQSAGGVSRTSYIFILDTDG
jgi:acetyl-CoA acetyltransferase